MKKPKPPKTVAEVEAYIREKSLNVDPEFFFEYFEAADWYDSIGKPVLSWKQKLLTWDRKQLEQGKRHRCTYCGCKKPGVYIAGRDDAGMAYWRCVDHKPGFRAVMEDMTDVFKSVPGGTNVNNERNRQMAGLTKPK